MIPAPSYTRAFINKTPALRANIHAPPSSMLLLMKACMIIYMQKITYKNFYSALLLAIAAVLLTSCDGKKHDANKNSPSNSLKVVIIRHGEKPKDGDNLSCQGQNRALQLASVLHAKLNVPDEIYVPSLKSDDTTKHSRMFQTISPFAIKYNLPINSKYSADENEKIAKSIFKKDGLVLMVWEHTAIQALAGALGVNEAPQWAGADFDSVWIINYQNEKAKLSIEKEGINPSAECNY
jgi:hypothetical protein